MAIWQKSWYKRGGHRTDLGKQQISWRNRHSGQVKLGSPKGNTIGYEVPKGNPYGYNPRSKVQALRDLKSFHQVIPARLKRR